MVDAHTWYTGGVRATGRTDILADLADHLGADWAGDINVSMGVLDVDGGALWVLVVLDLGCVLDALLGLDDVLTCRRLVDDAATNIKEGRGLRGPARHFICDIYR